MKQPMIGVMPLMDDEKESLWMLPGYFDGIMEAGGIPVMLPLTNIHEILLECAVRCDGFLFSGGHDISPITYGEAVLNSSVKCCPIRDRMESIILKRVEELRKPVLGICRGIQFINVFHGGTLYQDLSLQHPSEINHHQSPPYEKPIHKVTIKEGSPLHALCGKTDLAVNSYHHQAIKDLGRGLEVMATSSDGLVEAVRLKDYGFLWGVQWHPEFSHEEDLTSKKIFRMFVDEARNAN